MSKSILKINAFVFALHFLTNICCVYAKPPQSWPSDGVLVFPEATNKPILEAIREAQKSIDVALYRLDDIQVINELREAKKRGVQVRVILPKPNLYPEPFTNSENQGAITQLSDQGIITHHLPDHRYVLAHYKFMIVDGNYALIQTLNYDDDFSKARNFGLLIDAPIAVKNLQTIFENDFSKKSAENDAKALDIWNQAKIILGPNQQRQLITQFLNSAKSSIYIYQQDISDAEIAQTLNKLGKEGKKIYLIMPPAPFGGIDLNRINHTIIKAAGGEIRFLPKKPLYIHAKVVLIDPEKEGRVYVGSCNFWPQAISVQRELGVITENKAQVKRIFEVFKHDWENGVSYEEALEVSKR